MDRPSLNLCSREQTMWFFVRQNVWTRHPSSFLGLPLELVKNAESQPPPRPAESERALSRIPRWFVCKFKRGQLCSEFSLKQRGCGWVWRIPIHQSKWNLQNTERGGRSGGRRRPRREAVVILPLLDQKWLCLQPALVQVLLASMTAFAEHTSKAGEGITKPRTRFQSQDASG